MPIRNKNNVFPLHRRGYYEILKQIQQVRQKICLKERTRAILRVQTEEQVKENEGIIRKSRVENEDLREANKPVSNEDRLYFVTVFGNRPKHESLCLKTKTPEDVKYHVGEIVYGARKHLDVKHFYRKRKSGDLTNLEQESLLLKEADRIENVIDVEGRRIRQVENTLEKVKLKNKTGVNIKEVYLKIKKRLEHDLLKYPTKLDRLEKEKVELENEVINISRVRDNALKEAEKMLKKNEKVSNQVRSDKKKREDDLRALKSTAGDLDRYWEEEQTRQHTLALQRRATRIETKEERMRRNEEKRLYCLRQIEECEQQCSRLESATGVPFVSQKKLIWCLKKQIDTEIDLTSQAERKAAELMEMKDVKLQLSADLHQLTYEFKQGLREKISNTGLLLGKNEEKAEKTKRDSVINTKCADKAMAYSSTLLSHLIRTVANLNIEIPEHVRERYEANDVSNIFEDLLETVIAFYKQTEEKLKDSDSTKEELLDCSVTEELAEVIYLFNDNNVRIPHEIERPGSDEYDTFNLPNNEEYISRQMIKLHAEIPSRPKRKRKISRIVKKHAI